MPGNNIAEIVLRVTTEGTQNAQALAGQLVQLDQTGKQVAVSMLSVAAAQRAQGAEVARTDSQLEKLTRDWANLDKQVDRFSAHTLQSFASTSARALTEWIEGSKNARQAFVGFVNSVIEGIIQMAIQQGIAHALGIGQVQAAASAQSAANAQVTASAAPAAAMQGAATFGANAVGVGLVLAAVLAGIGVLLATRRAEGGPIYGAGTETSDSIPAWLSHNEYVHTAAAHRYYGTAAMDAINARSVPREAIHAALAHRSFGAGGMVTMLPAFAGGGFIGSPTGKPVPSSISVYPTPALFGDAMIASWLASSAGQRALDKHLEMRASRLARSTKKAGGHRSEA
jgi:hypothetical protein